MNAYEISKGVDVTSLYVKDLGEVRTVVRSITREMRDEVRVHLSEFPHDKAAFVQLLNGFAIAGKIRRTWRPGSRGGTLIEMKPEGDQP